MIYITEDGLKLAIISTIDEGKTLKQAHQLELKEIYLCHVNMPRMSRVNVHIQLL